MSTIEAELTTDEDDDLATEMRKLQSASDGEIIYGVVTSEPYEKVVSPNTQNRDTVHGETRICVEVETPISSFTTHFKKPKPPIEGYPVQRFADEYGQGLVDLDALAGEKVPCKYDEDVDQWSIVVPEDTSLRSTIRSIPGRASFDLKSQYPLLSFIFWPALIMASPLFSFGSHINEDVRYAAQAALLTTFWTVVVLMFIVRFG